MANTIIQVKRSTSTATPPNGSLTAGELAYSFNSGKLFIGNTAGTGVIAIGGNNYTELLDSATASNTASAIMKRDAGGEVSATTFIGNLRGRANTSQVLETARNISVSGDVSAPGVPFDGSAAIDLSANLSTTGVGSGVYGSESQVPVFTVDSKGRITSASNVAIASAGSMSFFRAVGDSGSSFIVSNNETLIISGVDGIATASPSDNLIRINVDSTVVRTTGSQTIGGSKTFTSDMIVNANLIVTGVRTFANTQQLDIGDNIIVLNADLPIGTAPSENAGVEINRGSAHSNASIYWDETNDWWTAVSNVLLSGASILGRIHTDSYANATALSVGTVPSARISGSYTGITGLGTITVGTWQGANVEVGFGGTGRSSFTLNGVLYGNTAGPLKFTSAPTEGQVLQGNASGVPTFAMVDGGNF